MEPELKEVTSTNISHVGYHEATKTLHIRFKASGTTYAYKDFPAEEHKALLSAESIGKHFGLHVRPKYQGIKLEEPEPATEHSHV